jgi:hypothetical protein
VQPVTAAVQALSLHPWKGHRIGLRKAPCDAGIAAAGTGRGVVALMKQAGPHAYAAV